MRSWESGDGWIGDYLADARAMLAYLDSIPEDAVPVVWPKELTREYLEWCTGYGRVEARNKALRALAAIAPKREKRKVSLWRRNGDLFALALDARPYNDWTRVGEGEIEE